MSAWGEDLAAWWLDEVEGDPAYRDEVLPLVREVAGVRRRETWLDLGCGEGRVMRAFAELDAVMLGCDMSPTLAAHAGPGTVVARLPDLEWVRSGSIDGALAVLVLEHLEDHELLLEAAASAVRAGGRLAMVLNHPAFTAQGSAPVIDADDGEVLWRWGGYLEPGVTYEPAGGRTMAFFHRPVGDLLEAAARSGWALDRFVERAVGTARAESDSLLAGQTEIPRLLGLGWERR